MVPAVDTAPRGPALPRPRRTVRLTWRAAFLAVATILAVLVVRNVFEAAHRIIGWAVAASIVAVLLRPAVEVLDRWIPRALAIAVVFLMLGGVTGVVAYGVVDDLRTETSALRRQGPEAARRLAGRDDRVGEIARDLRLPERAVDAFDALEERFGLDRRALASAAVGTVPAYFVSFILTLFLVVYGPGIASGALAQLPPDQRERWTRALHTGVQRGRRYLWVALAQGAVVGAATFAVARTLDLPAPTVLAVVAGGGAMVPYIGLLIGAIPTVLLAAGLENVRIGLAVFVAVALLQIVEALVLRRVVDRRTLHVGPAVPVIVGVIGLEVYGIGGAVFAIAGSVLILAVTDALSDDAPLPTPSDDWVEL